MRPNLPCLGGGLPVLPGNPALRALREFRERLLRCLAPRVDALLELADSVLCSDRLVRSLAGAVQDHAGSAVCYGHVTVLTNRNDSLLFMIAPMRVASHLVAFTR